MHIQFIQPSTNAIDTSLLIHQPNGLPLELPRRLVMLVSASCGTSTGLLPAAPERSEGLSVPPLSCSTQHGVSSPSLP